MKKKVLAIVIAMAVCLPCMLLLDGGPEAASGHETMQWTNFVGLGWMAFLVLGGFKSITPKWMQDELKAYIGEE